ncbi:MAG TPA: potassium channel family protein [Solirubrobacterales bacterium]|nr:potassium channel family protein [Solirubrobacterales bacterium]
MDERSLRIEAKFDWPMVIAALLVIPLLVIEESALEQPWDTVGVILNWGTWLAFAVEFVVMVWVAPRPSEWMKRHPLDVAVVFLTVPVIPAFTGLRLLRLLRLGRVFTLKRLLSLQGVRYAALIALMTVVIGGALFAAVEQDQDLSSWDGIWWAVSTMTTVGYGDISPATDAGRVLAITIMVVGIGFVALLTAFVADRFIQREVEEVEEREDQVLGELREIRERLDRLEQT